MTEAKQKNAAGSSNIIMILVEYRAEQSFFKHFIWNVLYLRVLEEISSGRALQTSSQKHNEGKEASKQCGVAQYISTGERESTEVSPGHGDRGRDFRFFSLNVAGRLCLARGPEHLTVNTEAGTCRPFLAF